LVPGLAELRAAKGRSERRTERRITGVPGMADGASMAGGPSVAAAMTPGPSAVEQTEMPTAPQPSAAPEPVPAGDESLAARLSRRRRSAR